jgi:hypothetical protein
VRHFTSLDGLLLWRAGLGASYCLFCRTGRGVRCDPTSKIPREIIPLSTVALLLSVHSPRQSKSHNPFTNLSFGEEQKGSEHSLSLSPLLLFHTHTYTSTHSLSSIPSPYNLVAMANRPADRSGRPMKKKGGGPLAGIPRQSGERSPTGNGAANNMVRSASSLMFPSPTLPFLFLCVLFSGCFAAWRERTATVFEEMRGSRATS